MVLGVFGGLRLGSELLSVQVDDIVEAKEGFKVFYVPAKTGKKKPEKMWFFLPINENEPFSPARIISIYKQKLSPLPGRFLRNFNKQSGTYVQNLGINSLFNVGKWIAEWLKLQNPSEFTSHCFRRTAATLITDSGASIQQMMVSIYFINFCNDKTAILFLIIIYVTLTY